MRPILRQEHTVDLHLAVRNDRLDQALLLQLLDALAGKRAVDLQSIDESSDGDETVRLDILVELVGGGLVEQDGVLCLVLDLALGPLQKEPVRSMSQGLDSDIVFDDDACIPSSSASSLLCLRAP